MIAWQFDLARELGCERIICICEGTGPELIDLQRSAEADGLQFNLIRGPLQLVGLVSADQELVAIADGLVIDRALATSSFAERRGVAALPAQAGIAAGFERIDAEYAWAGLLITRANIAEKLAEMPPDSDTIALLLRLALQAGTPVIPIDKERLDSADLMLADAPEKLVARENALLNRGASSAPWIGPGNALAQRLSRKLAPGALEKGPMAALGLSALASTAAIGLAAFEQSFWAILLLGLGAFSLACGQGLRDIRSRLFGKPAQRRFTQISNGLFDISAIATLTLPAVPFTLAERLFLPLVMVGMLRLSERLVSGSLRALWSDRILLAALLAPAAWFGVTSQAMALIVLIALGFCLIWRDRTPITRN